MAEKEDGGQIEDLGRESDAERHNDEAAEDDRDFTGLSERSVNILHFYDRYFDEMTDDERVAIDKELDRQERYEHDKHDSIIQRFGFMMAFSSLILIETSIYLIGGADLSNPRDLLVFAATVIFVLCSAMGVFCVTFYHVYPQVGVHAWDLEDVVVGGIAEDIEYSVCCKVLDNLEWLIYFNIRLNRMLTTSCLLLLSGLVLIFTATIMSVIRMGFLDRYRKPINRQEQEARGFHNPPGYTGMYRSEEQKKKYPEAGKGRKAPKGIRRTSPKRTPRRTSKK